MPEQAENHSALAEFEAALPALRPDLHRYAARMTGSVIDGEDVVQEALLKASRALAGGLGVTNLRSWLFGIAHNTALNFLRSRKSEAAMKESARQFLPAFEEKPKQNATADTLRPLMVLTPKQRSTLILRDVLGYSAVEVARLTGVSVDAVKSALHRARARLKTENAEEAEAPSMLSQADQQNLSQYAEYFNTQQFDRLRDLLAAEVHLELVSVEERSGKRAVGGYFANYKKRDDWLMVPGLIEGRPCILAFDRDDPSGPPNYFILIKFDGSRVRDIRDFRYARYVMSDAQWQRI